MLPMNRSSNLLKPPLPSVKHLMSKLMEAATWPLTCVFLGLRTHRKSSAAQRPQALLARPPGAWPCLPQAQPLALPLVRHLQVLVPSLAPSLVLVLPPWLASWATR